MRHTARAAHRLPQCGKQERDKLRKAGTRFPAGPGSGARLTKFTWRAQEGIKENGKPSERTGRKAKGTKAELTPPGQPGCHRFHIQFPREYERGG